MEASDKIIADITEDGAEVRLTGTEGTSLYRFKDTLKTVLGTTYRTKDKTWYMPFEWPAIVSLIGTFPDILQFTVELREAVEEMQETIVYPALDLREKVDADGYDDLRGYQRADVQFLKTAGRALLFNGMGSGKTRSVISTLQAHFESGEDIFPVLVVAPSATKYPWKKEFDAVWPGLEVTVVDGTASKRRKQLETPAHVYVMNYESVRTHSKLAPYGNQAMRRCTECGGQDPKVKASACQVHEKELNRIDFGAVVADECFVAGVQVDTPEGLRNIEDIREGDLIYGYDHETSSVVTSKVLGTMRKKSDTIVEELGVTPNHPYFVVGSGYIEVSDLTDDDRIMIKDGEDVHVVPFGVYRDFEKENVL